MLTILLCITGENDMWPGPQNKTKSLKFQFWDLHNTKSESWINKLYTGVWFARIWDYLAEIQLFEYLESEIKILRKSL